MKESPPACWLYPQGSRTIYGHVQIACPSLTLLKKSSNNSVDFLFCRVLAKICIGCVNTYILSIEKIKNLIS